MEAETEYTGLPPGEGGDIEELLARGRRYYICSNFSLASQSFQEACQMLSDKHGEMSKELVEPYYWYGKSLLELARQESCVLGGGVPGPPTQSDSSDEEEEEEPTTSNDQIEDSTQVGATPTEGEGSQEVEGSKEATPTGGEGSKEATPTGEETEEDKDVSTLQLAWEVLEVAKLISQNLQSTDYQLLLAEINLLLGEIGLESDQYDQAIEDFTTCLQIREAVLSADDRKLAEIHFNLGLTYSLLKRPQDSVIEFGLAKQVLELRKEKLQSDADREAMEGEKIKCLKEIDEINDLLPDIEAKIIEESVADDSKKEGGGGIGLEEDEDDDDEEGVSCSSIGFNAISSTGMNIFSSSNQETVASNGAVSSSTSSSSSSRAPVNDISHLVKKKPKISDQQTKEEEELPVTTNGCLSHNEAVPLKKRRISLTTITEDEADHPVRKKVPSLLASAPGVTEADSTTITPTEQ